MPSECVCCKSRVDSKSQRPFNSVSLRLFVAARRGLPIAKTGSICNSCRMIFLKWRRSTEFVDCLNMIDKKVEEEDVDSNEVSVNVFMKSSSND